MNERPLIVRMRRTRKPRPAASSSASQTPSPVGFPSVDATSATATGTPGTSGIAVVWEQDVLPAAMNAADCLRLGKDDVRIWSLVLLARRVPHRLERGAGPPRLIVPLRHTQRAVREIASYEHENRQEGRPLPEPVFRENSSQTLLVLVCLALFYAISSTHWQLFGFWPADPVDWIGRGSANAYAILIRGEWWRCLTALTLHADIAHLAANLVVGAFVFVPLMRELGSGTGWALTLCAGAAGNFINSQAFGARHDSLGASTAVFGAIGILGAVRGLREHGLSLRRAAVPIAGAAGLLAFLGAGESLHGGRVDVGAHFFGFFAGVGLGACIGLYYTRCGRPPVFAERLLAAGALAAPVVAWCLALSY